jgi:hypothetical protein
MLTAAGLRPVKAYKLLYILQIGQPTAGYKACYMLATYCWKSMVKLNKKKLFMTP